MQASPNFYVSLVYLLAAIPYAWLGLFAWRKSPAVAVTPFAWAMLGLSIWSFAYSLELLLPSLPLKLFFARVEYFGSVSIPVFLLFFTLEYTDKSHLLHWRTRLLLWGIPILSLLLVWSNDFHRLVWSGEIIVNIHGLQLLSVRYGLFFWIQIIYSNSLALFTGLFLAVEMLQRSKVYRIQISFIILGIMALVAGSLLYVNRINPIMGLNITPLLFLPIVTGISWAIARYSMLEIIPLEHLTVLKNMKDGVIVANLDGRILYINPVVETLFGCLEKDVVGQPLEQISEKYGAMLASHLDRTEHHAEILVDSKYFEATVSPIASRNKFRGQSSPGNILILHDITKRKRSEAALHKRETMMSALNLAAERFLKEATWEHNIPGILEKIGQAINVSRVYVFMNYSDEQGTVYSSQLYEWAALGVTPLIDDPDLRHLNLREAGYGRWVDELSKGRSIHGVVAGFPETEKTRLQKQDILSLAVMPIFVEKQWWGFLGFDECKEARQWEEAELEALHITASIFGSAEARARTEQRLIRRQRTLTLQQEIVSEALSARTLRLMAQNIVDQLAHLISANDCFITLWDEYDQQTFPLASYDSKDTYLSIQPVSDGKTLTELALQRGHTIIVEDAYNSPYLEPEIALQCPSHSLIILPLMAAENKLGAIILAFNSHRRFQSEEILVCEQASNLIALAFEKFRTMEQAQQRAVTSETLRKAGVAVTETLKTDETVSRILEQLKDVIPYDTASVQLLDGNELEIIGGSGFADLSEVVGMRFPVPDNNPNTVVIQTGKPYLLSDVGDVYGEFKKPPHNHIHSWLGVPLIFQERVIGLLAVDSSTPNHFTRENISLVSAFADQVAVSLENARAYERVQKQAITDALTGVYNRRGLFQSGEFEFTRAQRTKRRFCALMLDIDHFKRVNDHYGHATGDQALRQLAERCKAGIRGIDIIGRYGGEEFVILLPETPLEAGCILAERLRAAVEGSSFPTDSGPLRITVSIGAAEAGALDTLNKLIERADSALYKAKNAGRNCVRVSETPQA
jgi:diguanylate cyclase (GGDEF)-like protein/PAS domain S-box-containing protein